MNSKVLFCILVMALFVNGCVSEFHAKLPSEDLQILIVDGSIIQNTDAIFYLSKSIPLDSAYRLSESIISNANLTITGSDGYKSKPATYTGNGSYRISIGELNDNVEYGVEIEYDGNIYQSTPSKPLHTPEIDSVSWIQPEKYGDVFFHVSTHDDTGQASFFIWHYYEDWESPAYMYTTTFYNMVSDFYSSGNYYIIDPAPYYYCWRKAESDKILIGSTESLNENSIKNKQLYSRTTNDYRFSELYSVNVTQMALSKSAFEYYQNKIVLNDEMGGIFTPQPAELTGNITCITDPSKKVIGYVEPLKNITQKRIFIPSSSISRIHSYECFLLPTEDINAYCAENDITFESFYALGFRPIGVLNPLTGLEFWALINCSDCVANGGSKNKPDFWPNDHK